MLELRKPGRLQVARSPEEERLNSWKEIAGYLGREQRTVQRWEASEGLPVHRLQHGKAGSVFAFKSELDAWVAQRSGKAPAAPAALRKIRSRWIWLGVAGLLVVPAAAWLILAGRSPSANVLAPQALTNHPGPELEPRLSPNAAQVAYVWTGEAEDNYDIYVKMLSGGAALRLTTDPADDYSPAWSPDGSEIAFLRRTGSLTVSIFRIPVLGGAERKIADVHAAAWSRWARPGPFLAWSPDGKWLITSGWAGTEVSDVLLRVPAEGGAARPLLKSPSNASAEMAPAFSSDGRTLAFSRLMGWARSEICLLPLSAAVEPEGEVRTLNTGSAWNTSPAWMPDGRSLVFSMGDMDRPSLATMAVNGSGPATRLLGEGDYGWLPTVLRAPNGRARLVYTQHFESVNIWRSDLSAGKPAERLIDSAHWSYEPAWSADGKRVVFLSDRSGYGEIWVADQDGKRPQQWTFLKLPRLGSPRWSPDGRRIAFTAPGPRGSSIFLIDGPAAAPRPVPGAERCGYIDWSSDGKSIFYSSASGANYDIWKIAAEGGEPVRMTFDRGRVPSASSDGKYLYFLKLAGADGRNDLWRLPLNGGKEEKVLEFVDAYSLGDTGIAFKFYRPGERPAGPFLEFHSFAAGKTERLPAASRPLRYGIALSRDGRRLLHAQADYDVSDLMLVDLPR